jgi:glycosyltransferase involved in cell wall biosynthesis
MSTSSPAATLRKLRRFNRWFDGFTPETDGRALPLSVNVSGYLKDESGWGALARGYIRALRYLGVTMRLEDFSALTSNRSGDRTVLSGNALADWDVNLMCIDAGQHFAVLSNADDDLLDRRYNIGAWAWELPRFPDRWYDRFAYYDEIWVGSSFIASALSHISPIPVIRIPPVMTRVAPVTPDETPSDWTREWKRRQDEFLFLFLFDVHSHLARKNPLAVIEAFRQAFQPSEPVRLILKCVNASSDLSGLAEMRSRATGAAIEIHDGYIPSAEVRGLMSSCDAYVSLHRSEGIGLTIAEAMDLGKPVIATGWSGNTDFMDVSNAFPVGYRLVEIEQNVGPYHEGEVWAEPSVEHAAALMRWVVDHPDQARTRGDAARQTIQRDYSEEAIAGLIRQRLDLIGERHRFDEFRRDVRALVSGYRDLVHDIQKVVGRVVPAGGEVMVVSKGDNLLLQFEGRPAWHFPATDEGVYLGYHPADSAAAIATLESAIDKGHEYLLFPGTSLWWLDHYAEFRSHLDDRYQRIWSDRQCVLYDVRRTRPAAVAR